MLNEFNLLIDKGCGDRTFSASNVRQGLSQTFLHQITGEPFQNFQSYLIGRDQDNYEFLIASKNEQSDLWAVEKFEHSVKDGTERCGKKTMAKDTCFFDALYYVAEYEHRHALKAMASPTGKVPTTTSTLPFYKDVPHYKKIVEALGLQNAEGMIRPILHGLDLSETTDKELQTSPFSNSQRMFKHS